jgi:hypothetical protein
MSLLLGLVVGSLLAVQAPVTVEDGDVLSVDDPAELDPADGDPAEDEEAKAPPLRRTEDRTFHSSSMNRAVRKRCGFPEEWHCDDEAQLADLRERITTWAETSEGVDAGVIRLKGKPTPAGGRCLTRIEFWLETPQPLRPDEVRLTVDDQLDERTLRLRSQPAKASAPRRSRATYRGTAPGGERCLTPASGWSRVEIRSQIRAVEVPSFVRIHLRREMVSATRQEAVDGLRVRQLPPELLVVEPRRDPEAVGRGWACTACGGAAGLVVGASATAIALAIFQQRARGQGDLGSAVTGVFCAALSPILCASTTTLGALTFWGASVGREMLERRPANGEPMDRVSAQHLHEIATYRALRERYGLPPDPRFEEPEQDY